MKKEKEWGAMSQGSEGKKRGLRGSEEKEITTMKL
jgi:hypothetical protein